MPGVSRRGRALAFLLAALLAAVAAAAVADRYGRSVAGGYGELRRVVVVTGSIEPGEAIDPVLAGERLELRRVPARFVPPGSLVSAADAVGLVSAAPIPAGSYLLASALRPPRRAGSGGGLGHGRRPVEIAVSGAAALLVAGGRPAGARVDVVVTSEPDGGGPGRTYVAAAAVPLLGLGPGADGAEAGGTDAATLGLTRPQALRLIAAQSFARQITILPRG